MTVESARAAKRALRAELLARRDVRTPVERDRLGSSLARTGLGQPELAAARFVCGYVGVGTEPATIPLLDALRAGGTAVLLPVLATGRELAWAPYVGQEALVLGPYGLLQPTGESERDVGATVDLMLVPALAVDRRGSRLGRGGGYYDRFLARVAASAGGGGPAAWAVVYDDEVLSELPGETHDVPVRGALTPTAFAPLPRR